MPILKFPTFFSEPPVTQGCLSYLTKVWIMARQFWPIHLVLEISRDMRSSSAAYKRSDSAIFHSLSIPFKVSLNLLFTDSHLLCQGVSRDLNQVLCGPVQANIFTCVRLGRLNYCIPWVSTVFVRRPAERQQHVCLWKRYQEVCVKRAVERAAGSHVCRKERRSSGNDPADLKTTTSITFSPDTQAVWHFIWSWISWT